MRSTNFGPLVGLKMQGGGKVDTTRRALIGLMNKAKQPSPLATVSQTQQPAAPSPLATFVENAVQAPMSRREFMEKTGKTAASQAIQDLAGGMGVQTIAKMAAKSAVPKKTQAEIAEALADYATKVLDNPPAIEKAFQVAMGESVTDYFGSKDWPLFDVVQQIGFTNDRDAVVNAAKAIGLDIEGISRATGLSVKDITKVIKDDAELLESLSNTSRSANYLQGILEDGRPKEAYRSTSLSDIDEDEVDDIIEAVIKEYGKDADANDIIGEVSDRVRNRFFEAERAGDDPLSMALSKRVLKDPLDQVYKSVTDDDYLGLYDRVYDRLPSDED